MNLSVRALPGNYGRRPLFAFGFLAFCVVAAYEAAGYGIAGDIVGLFRLPSLAPSAEFSAGNPDPNHRRMWMR